MKNEEALVSADPAYVIPRIHVRQPQVTVFTVAGVASAGRVNPSFPILNCPLLIDHSNEQ